MISYSAITFCITVQYSFLKYLIIYVRVFIASKLICLAVQARVCQQFMGALF